MATSKQIIVVVYGVFADNNLSRILPVLDEKIVLYLSEYGPGGSEYHGRSGFLTMMRSTRRTAILLVVMATGRSN